MRCRSLALLALLSSTAAAQEVLSDGGKFLARVHPHGDVEVVAASEAQAAPLWSAHGLSLAPADAWMLSGDGRSLVGIAAHAEPARPIVQVVRIGNLLVSADATALSLAPDLEPDWLARGSCSLRLRSIAREGRTEFALDLLGRDFCVRRIDLETGAIRLPSGPASVRKDRTPLVDVAAALEGTVDASVSQWDAPDLAIAGQALPVRARGTLPDSAWRFSGFSLSSLEDDRYHLLRARAIAPAPGTISSPVIRRFDETAKVFGLEPGVHRIGAPTRSLLGSEETRLIQTVRVLPQGALAFLQKLGGPGGFFENVVLFEDGRVELENYSPPGGHCLASDDERAAVNRALARLPAALAKTAKGGAADTYSYELAWNSGGHWLRVFRDEETLESELRALAEALEGVETGCSGLRRCNLEPHESFVQVRTTISGPTSGPGREYRLSPRKFGGTIEVYPPDLSQSSVVLHMESGSLAAVDEPGDPDGTKEGSEFEREIGERVLEVARFPAIEFKSRRIEVKSSENEIGSPLSEGMPAGFGTHVVEVAGALTMHGVTRSIRALARFELETQGVRATGKMKLRPAEFGISTSPAAAGSVPLADEIEISFELRAKFEIGHPH